MQNTNNIKKAIITQPLCARSHGSEKIGLKATHRLYQFSSGLPHFSANMSFSTFIKSNTNRSENKTT